MKGKKAITVVQRNLISSVKNPDLYYIRRPYMYCKEASSVVNRSLNCSVRSLNCSIKKSDT